MSSAASFSSDGVEVISRQVELPPVQGRRGAGLEEYYEMDRCRKFIVESHYWRVWF